MAKLNSTQIENGSLWDSTSTTVSANSAAWISTTNLVRSTSGTWSNTYTTVSSNSAQWSSSYTTVASNSALWNNTYTNIQSNSALWANTYTTVASNSALWASNVDTAVRDLTGNWQNTYTTVNTTSSTWGTDTAVRALTSNWQSTYTTVNTTSSTWGGGGSGADTAVRDLTGNWQSTYTTVNTTSSTWGGGGGTTNAFTLITTLSVNNNSTVQLPLTGGYTKFNIEFDNLCAATTSGDFRARFSVNNGATFISDATAYFYGHGFVVNYSPTQANAAYIVVAPLMPVKTNGVHGFFQIETLGSASTKARATYLTSFETWNATSISMYQGAAYLNGLSAVNAVQFYTTSGNLSGGVIRLYGR